jgi:hypothetical protein
LPIFVFARFGFQEKPELSYSGSWFLEYPSAADLGGTEDTAYVA